MRDDTQTDQTRAPEAEERAVGVASVPDDGTAADDGQPRLVDNGDHDYLAHDQHTDDDEHGVAEAHGMSEAQAGETGIAPLAAMAYQLAGRRAGAAEETTPPTKARPRMKPALPIRPTITS